MTKLTPEQLVQERARRKQEGLLLFRAYDRRDEVKALDGIFDGTLRCWLMPDESSLAVLGARKTTGRHGPYWTLATDPAPGQERDNRG